MSYFIFKKALQILKSETSFECILWTISIYKDKIINSPHFTVLLFTFHFLFLPYPKTRNPQIGPILELFLLKIIAFEGLSNTKVKVRSHSLCMQASLMVCSCPTKVCQGLRLFKWWWSIWGLAWETHWRRWMIQKVDMHDLATWREFSRSVFWRHKRPTMLVIGLRCSRCWPRLS